MEESILIKNTTMISPEKRFYGDILIQDGVIKKIDAGIAFPAQTIIDGTHWIILPGIIDPHVHLREPGFEWKEDMESGSRAAAAGGVTTVFDMPNTNPPTISKKTIEFKKKSASQKCLVNYNFFAGATVDNIQELNSLENIPGIKVFMGSSTGNLLIPDQESLKHIFMETNHLIAVHAEDEDLIQFNKKKYPPRNSFLDHLKIRGTECALKAVKHALSFSKRYRKRLHILHISSEEEILYLADKKHPFISAEICPQHFLLSAPEIYEKLNGKIQVNPPVRYKKDALALWNGIKTGIIDCLATDHAPHTLEEKSKPFGQAPSGIPGLETFLPLMLNQVNLGKCTLEDIVQWMCERPARLFRIKNKGIIREGMDADLVMIDLKKTKTIENGSLYTKTNWSPFHGFQITGWPVLTIVGGNIVFREGDFFTESKGKEVIIEPAWQAASGKGRR